MLSAIFLSALGAYRIAKWVNQTLHAEKSISMGEAVLGITSIALAALLVLSTTSYMPKGLKADERRIEFEVVAITQDQVPVRIKGSTTVTMDPRIHSVEAINAARDVIREELVAHMKTSAENEHYSAFYNRCTTGETSNWYNMLTQISAEHNSSLYDRAREIDEDDGGYAKDPYETIKDDRTPAMPPRLQSALSSVNTTWNGWVRITLEPTF